MTARRTKRTTPRNQSPNPHIHVDPTEHDILCSKDKSFANHPGNLLFREKIGATVEAYHHCGSKLTKMQMTKDLVASLDASFGSRFLKLENGFWVEISNQAARDKVSHALRFAAGKEASKKARRTSCSSTPVAKKRVAQQRRRRTRLSIAKEESAQAKMCTKQTQRTRPQRGGNATSSSSSQDEETPRLVVSPAESSSESESVGTMTTSFPQEPVALMVAEPNQKNRSDEVQPSMILGDLLRAPITKQKQLQQQGEMSSGGARRVSSCASLLDHHNDNEQTAPPQVVFGLADLPDTDEDFCLFDDDELDFLVHDEPSSGTAARGQPNAFVAC